MSSESNGHSPQPQKSEFQNNLQQLEVKQYQEEDQFDQIQRNQQSLSDDQNKNEQRGRKTKKDKKVSCMNNFYSKLGTFLKDKLRCFSKRSCISTKLVNQVQRRILLKKSLLRKDIVWLLNRPELHIHGFWEEINCKDAKKYIEENCFRQVQDDNQLEKKKKDIAEMLEGVDFFFLYILKDDWMFYGYTPFQRKKQRKSRLDSIFVTHQASKSNEQRSNQKLKKFQDQISDISTLLNQKIQRNPSNIKVLKKYLQQKIEKLRRLTLNAYFLSLSQAERQEQKRILQAYYLDNGAGQELKKNVSENDFVFIIKLFELIHWKLYNELYLSLQKMIKNPQITILQQNVSGNWLEVVQLIQEINFIVTLLDKYQNCQKVQTLKKIEEPDLLPLQDAQIGNFQYFSQPQVHILNEPINLENMIPMNHRLMDVEKEGLDSESQQLLKQKNEAIEQEIDPIDQEFQVEEYAEQPVQQSERQLDDIQERSTDTHQQIDVQELELLYESFKPAFDIQEYNSLIQSAFQVDIEDQTKSEKGLLIISKPSSL